MRIGVSVWIIKGEDIGNKAIKATCANYLKQKGEQIEQAVLLEFIDQSAKFSVEALVKKKNESEKLKLEYIPIKISSVDRNILVFVSAPLSIYLTELFLSFSV
ncbi:hypothetical protein VNO78_27081 [Psophocarpus tetragonolobus]|uniref:Uncharacterized protein n=1 Tax=Psophocarpus tetragonolobus TaxID=3891 RepID=A0AAN9XAP8_PSOTE